MQVLDRSLWGKNKVYSGIHDNPVTKSHGYGSEILFNIMQILKAGMVV